MRSYRENTVLPRPRCTTLYPKNIAVSTQATTIGYRMAVSISGGRQSAHRADPPCLSTSGAELESVVEPNGGVVNDGEAEDCVDGLWAGDTASLLIFFDSSLSLLDNSRESGSGSDGSSWRCASSSSRDCAGRRVVTDKHAYHCVCGPMRSILRVSELSGYIQSDMIQP